MLSLVFPRFHSFNSLHYNELTLLAFKLNKFLVSFNLFITNSGNTYKIYSTIVEGNTYTKPLYASPDYVINLEELLLPSPEELPECTIAHTYTSGEKLINCTYFYMNTS